MVTRYRPGTLRDGVSWLLHGVASIRWCQLCEQAVRLIERRHFCQRLMAYVFGAEHRPARPVPPMGVALRYSPREAHPLVPPTKGLR